MACNDLGGLQVELEELLGISVDALPPAHYLQNSGIGCTQHMRQVALDALDFVSGLSKEQFLLDKTDAVQVALLKLLRQLQDVS